MKELELTITPQRAALLAGHDNELNVLVRVRAPAAPDGTAPAKPLNLALVIDRSGSMSGRPLEEACRCAEFIVGSLKPEDAIALVTYDTQVTVDIPHRLVGDRKGLVEAIRAIVDGGSTALHDGWFAGAREAAQGRERASVSRVLLLSDGQANHGLTEPDEIAAHCAQLAQSGVTTSTYGLGHGFNEDLMLGMARAGLGNSYYGATAEDLMDPFREEFELVRALCARKLRLQLAAPDGVTVQVLNGYAFDPASGWQLPDLAWGGEAWAAVRLRVPAALADAAANGEGFVLEARVTFEDMEGLPLMLAAPALKLPWLPAAAFSAVASDPMVGERLGELRAAELTEKARLAARAGDWRTVDRLLDLATREAVDNPWLQGAVEALKKYAARRESEALSKEAAYQARTMRTRLADASEVAGSYVEGVESEKAAYLRRKMEKGRRMGGNPPSRGTGGPAQ